LLHGLKFFETLWFGTFETFDFLFLLKRRCWSLWRFLFFYLFNNFFNNYWLDFLRHNCYDFLNLLRIFLSFSSLSLLDRSS
jgi:hypothetical protein